MARDVCGSAVGEVAAWNCDVDNKKIQHAYIYIYIYIYIRGLLEKYPTFGREKETGLLGALDT